jgi:guanine deaminase
MKARFMREAIRISFATMWRNHGGPFGAVVVRRGKIIGRGWNQVTSTNDPTAHAEVVAIRAACRRLKTFHLEDCDLYASCEPCPMCLAAIYWVRLKRVYFANTRKDAAWIGFNDDFIYREVAAPISKRKIPLVQLLRSEALTAFKAWMNRVGGRICLPPPTPPDMRVRVRRFLTVPKDDSALSLSALLARGSAQPFGVIASLRPATGRAVCQVQPFTGCETFRGVPRLVAPATMASADSCAPTTTLADRRARRCHRAGSTGLPE